MTTAPLGAFFFLGTLMAETYVCFIDVGYLRAEGAKALGARARNVRPDAEKVAEWARSLRGLKAVDAQFLRAYWYDGAFDPSHPEYAGQRRFFNAIALTPGIQLRLGHIAERQHRLRNPIRSALRNSATSLGVEPDQLLEEFDRNWTFYPERQQKGVDTLIALDMVRLASRSVCETMVLIAGDRDLAEVVRTVQDFGIRVLIASPNCASIAQELAQLADHIIGISAESILQIRADS